MGSKQGAWLAALCICCIVATIFSSVQFPGHGRQSEYKALFPSNSIDGCTPLSIKILLSRSGGYDLIAKIHALEPFTPLNPSTTRILYQSPSRSMLQTPSGKQNSRNTHHFLLPFSTLQPLGPYLSRKTVRQSSITLGPPLQSFDVEPDLGSAWS